MPYILKECTAYFILKMFKVEHINCQAVLPAKYVNYCSYDSENQNYSNYYYDKYKA